METTHESSRQTLRSAQPSRPYAFSRKVFCEGMRDGVPIALGYFAVSFSLGIAARTAGFTPLQGFVASLLNNASAGEYAAFALIASGATYLEVAIITLIANARYLLMSCALAQRFAPGTPFFHRLIIGYDVTDELFGITIARRLSEPLLHLRRYRAGPRRRGLRVRRWASSRAICCLCGPSAPSAWRSTGCSSPSSSPRPGRIRSSPGWWSSASH